MTGKSIQRRVLSVGLVLGVLLGIVPLSALSSQSGPVCTMACADTDRCCCAAPSSAAHPAAKAQTERPRPVLSAQREAGCPYGCATMSSGVRVPPAPALRYALSPEKALKCGATLSDARWLSRATPGAEPSAPRAPPAA